MILRLAPILVAVLSACTDVRNKGADPRPVQEPTPVEVADPMASFARLIPGDWRVTFGNGTSAFTTWQWGPGKHSIHGDELELMYWHPGRKQVRLLSLHPDIPGVGRGSGEGMIRFEGETAEGVLDLYQPRGLRKLGIRWEFDGPDKYHDTLLEATGPEGFKLANEWDRYRVAKRSDVQPHTVEETPKLPEHLKIFEALLGAWETKGDSVIADASRTESTFEFVPDYIYARVITPSKDGESTHLLDAYVYQDVRTQALRCLALSNSGGVYEGDVIGLEGGALQLDLKSYEGDRVVPCVVRFDFEEDGSLRSREWSLVGSDRKLLHDVHHERIERKKKD